MTQYSVALWMDSDSLAVRSLHPLFDQATRIPPPRSAEPGPRIGAAYNGQYYVLYPIRYNNTISGQVSTIGFLSRRR